jgi:hypothetical protein
VIIRWCSHALHLLADGPLVALLSDLVYTWVDPRIDFEKREPDGRAQPLQDVDRSLTASEPGARGAKAVADSTVRRWATISRPTGAAGGRCGSSWHCFCAPCFAEFIANDRPMIVSYKGEILFPVLVDYPEENSAASMRVTDYYDPFIQEEIEANGWMIWPPIRYDHTTANSYMPQFPTPSPPFWMLDEERPAPIPEGAEDAYCTAWQHGNWLGTDDQGATCWRG